MKVWRIAAVAALGLVWIGFLAWRQDARAVVPTPDLGAVPEFAFVDQDGAPKTRGDFSGKPWLASFIFARCHDECPMIVSRMKALRPRLPAGVALASVSVDPADTPADLKAFAKAQGADWAFLVGKPDSVERFAQGLRLGLSGTGPEKGPLIHSNRLVLVDPSGKIRGYYDPEDKADAERLLVDAAKL